MWFLSWLFFDGPDGDGDGDGGDDGDSW